MRCTDWLPFQLLLKHLANIPGKIDVLGMIKKLILTSLLPLVAGKASMDASATFREYATYFSKLLTYISSAVIVFQPWTAISNSNAS